MEKKTAKPFVDLLILSPFSMTVPSNEHGSSSSSTSFSASPAPSSRTSLNSDSAHMLKTPTSPRHIRFAPLLDPRRAVVVTDDGHELPIKDGTHFPAATSLAVLRNGVLTSQTQKQACSDPEPVSSSSSLAFSSPTDLQSSTTSSSPYSPRSQSRSFSVGILKPFKSSSTSSKQKSRKSKSLSITPEEILTLGTINLFRSSTWSSDQDNFKENNDPSSHTGLSSRASADPSSSINPQSETEVLAKNPPLTRLQGVPEGERKKRRSSIAAFFSAAPGVSSLVGRTKSQKAKSNSTPATASSSPSASGSTITSGRPATPTPVLPPSQRAPRHKGARMLNGRIYGAKPTNRISENPFANARDDEPEFVEWGYGGMGSVKGARSAGVVGDDGRGAVNWERLSGQGGQSGWMVPGGGRGGAGSRRKQEKDVSRERRSGEADAEKDGEDGEDDDGSGLAWIRKRRKMREEKEKRMKETEHAAGSESIPTSPSAVGPQVANSATQTTIKASAHDPDLSHPEPRKVGPNAADEHHTNSTHNMGTVTVNGHHDHSMTAVSVPMPRPKLSSHHKRTSSRGGVEDEEAEKSATLATADDHANGGLEGVAQQESLARPSVSGSSSSTSSLSESSEEESDPDGEDSSEEDQDEDERRKTAIGAGVEKVFRHRGE